MNSEVSGHQASYFVFSEVVLTCLLFPGTLATVSAIRCTVRSHG